MDHCPMQRMDLSVDPPILARPCVDCEFCARLCPTGALDMAAWLKAMEDMTAGFARVDARPSGRSRERRTFQTTDTAQWG